MKEKSDVKVLLTAKLSPVLVHLEALESFGSGDSDESDHTDAEGTRDDAPEDLDSESNRKKMKMLLDVVKPFLLTTALLSDVTTIAETICTLGKISLVMSSLTLFL